MSEVDLAGVRWVQGVIKEMLGELDRVAEAAHFDYYLAYGSALGAVREGDIIPWDPDADVYVRWQDYDRVVASLRQHLAPKFEVVGPDTEEYEYYFARMALKGVHHTRLRVDLFPLAAAPTNRFSQIFYSRLSRLLSQAYLVKMVSGQIKLHYSTKKRLVLRVLKALLCLVRATWLRSAFRSWVAVNDRRFKRSGTVVNPCGSYGLREFLPSSIFDSHSRVAFGTSKLRVPAGVHAMLGVMYGDYLSPVDSEEQRRQLVFATEYFVKPLRQQGALPSSE